MARCNAFTQRGGAKCKNTARTGSQYCHTHANYVATPPKKKQRLEIDLIDDDSDQESTIATTPSTTTTPTTTRSSTSSSSTSITPTTSSVIASGNVEQSVNTAFNYMQQALQQLKQKEQQLQTEEIKTKEKQKQLDIEKSILIQLQNRLKLHQDELKLEHNRTAELNTSLQLKQKELVNEHNSTQRLNASLEYKEKHLKQIIAENSLKKDPRWYDFIPEKKKFIDVEHHYMVFMAYDKQRDFVFLSDLFGCSVKVYDKRGNLLKSIGSRGANEFSKQSGIAITSNSWLIAFEVDQGHFKILDAKFKLIRVISIARPQQYYRFSNDFALDENENIVVLAKNESECNIETYSLHGDLLKTVPISRDKLGEELRSLAFFSLTLFNNKFYICSRSMINVFSRTDGTHIASINPYQDPSYHSLFNPVSIQFTKSKRFPSNREGSVMIVATSDGLLYFFDMNGKYLTHIGKLKLPSRQICTFDDIFERQQRENEEQPDIDSVVVANQQLITGSGMSFDLSTI
jgi:hypothetical protein